MRSLVLLAVTGLFASDLAAQSVAERTRLESLRAEIGGVEDLAALAQRESLLVDVARENRDDPMIHLELGFLNFRLGEIADSVDSFYEAAASEFEWAMDLRPEWPYPYYGLGLAELALGEHELIAIENIRQILGIDHLSKAARAFARAAEMDPSFVQAVLDLADAASQQRIRPRLEVALEALRRAAATSAGSVPSLQLALGRMSREVGEMDSALVAFDRFVEVGGDSAIGLLELARTQFAVGRIRVARARYYRGAALVDSPEAVAQYRYDIAWIGTPEERAEFDELNGVGLDLWLRAFWERREAVDLRLPGERMAEHYRRYFYARANFRLLSPHRHYDITERFRSEQDEIDDRGIIYIRHGIPDRVASYNAPDVEANESWEYRWPDGQQIFHFVARDDVSDYKLVESLLDVYGFDGAMAIQATNGANLDRELFASRNHFNSLYRRLSSSGTASVMNDLSNERQQGARAIEQGTVTDSYAHRFVADLEPLIQGGVVAAVESGPSVDLLSFAVAGSDLQPRQTARGLEYAVAVRVSAIQGDRQVRFVDTTIVYTLREPMTEGEYLPGMFSLELEPGSYVLRMMIRDENSGAGSITALDSIFVPDRRDREPVIGDMVAGIRGWGLRWVMSGDTVYLNPTGQYPVGSQLEIHYEMYGMDEGLPYRARLEVKKDGGGGVFGFVRRVFGGGGNRISLEFPGVSDRGITSVSQTVDLAPLDPGDYEVKLTIRLPGGHSETRETTITVLEP